MDLNYVFFIYLKKQNHAFSDTIVYTTLIKRYSIAFDASSFPDSLEDRKLCETSQFENTTLNKLVYKYILVLPDPGPKSCKFYSK